MRTQLYPLSFHNQVIDGEFVFRPGYNHREIDETLEELKVDRKAFNSIGYIYMRHPDLKDAKVEIDVGFHGYITELDEGELSSEQQREHGRRIMITVSLYLEMCWGGEWYVEFINLLSGSSMEGWDESSVFYERYEREYLFPLPDPTPI